MLHTDPHFSPAVSEAVAAIERRSDAEVVVVAVARSGRYRDVVLASALAAALGVLAFVAWTPFPFAGGLFPIYAGCAAAAAAYIVRRSPKLIRRLAGADRLRDQVREAAQAAFFQESVHGTQRRTGVLVYVSVLEARVEIVPDHGLLGRIPSVRFVELDLRCESLPELVAGLGRLGDLLAEHVPALHDANPNEAPDAPRVRG